MTPVITHLATRHPDVIFVKADVDFDEDLARTFSIESMPTYHLVRRQQSIRVLKGAQSLTELESELVQAKAWVSG